MDTQIGREIKCKTNLRRSGAGEESQYSPGAAFAQLGRVWMAAEAEWAETETEAREK